ncbi:MAG: SDR family oxidoreductase [Clostridiales bacterium]
MESITPLKRNGKPQDIANIVSFLLSEEASFITGSDIRIDGGLVKNLISMESKKQ